MFIIIPLGKKYTSNAWGSVVKNITCAYCHTEFVYELRRLVAAQASAPAFIGTKSAEKRAQSGAQELLAQTLTKDDDLIPCPHCQRLQPSMNKIAREKWRAWIIIICFLFLMPPLMRYASTLGSHDPVPAWTFWLPIAAIAAASVAFIWISNREFRAAATDRAQLKSEAEAENFARLPMPRILKDGWLWLRPTRFVCPPDCIACGAPATEKLDRKLGLIEIHANVCANCHRRAQRIRSLWGLACFFGPALITALLFTCHADWDQSDLLLGCVAGFFAGLFVWAIANNWFLKRAGMPLRFRKYRPRQDSVEIQFKNPTATEHFLAQAIVSMQQTITSGPESSPTNP